MEIKEITFEIEEDLHKNFLSAADNAHLSTEFILCSLIREFLKKNSPQLSLEEIAKRKDAVLFAQASMELEGFIWSDEQKADFKRLVNGSVTPEMLIDKYIEEAHAFGGNNGQ